MSTPHLTVALCQMNSGAEVAANLATAHQQITDAAAAGAQLVCLPELFTCMSSTPAPKHAAAQPAMVTLVRDFLTAAAQQHQIHLAAGSFGVRVRGGKIRNRSLLIGPDGTELGRYDKMHLFQFNGPDYSYDETVDYVAGKKVVCCATALGRVGLSICYDLRFPELYRRMHQPDVVLVPAAFTRQTGRAHWELLLRSRAVENQCFVLGTAQCGTHPTGLRSWGHSLLVDPWGKVLSRLGEQPEVLLAQLDLRELAAVRQRLPALTNRVL